MACGLSAHLAKFLGIAWYLSKSFEQAQTTDIDSPACQRKFAKSVDVQVTFYPHQLLGLVRQYMHRVFLHIRHSNIGFWATPPDPLQGIRYPNRDSGPMMRSLTAVSVTNPNIRTKNLSFPPAKVYEQLLHERDDMYFFVPVIFLKNN
jgi:hypothetical protein